jgi:uncharacterized YceG family protein
MQIPSSRKLQVSEIEDTEKRTAVESELTAAGAPGERLGKSIETAEAMLASGNIVEGIYTLVSVLAEKPNSIDAALSVSSRRAGKLLAEFESRLLAQPLEGWISEDSGCFVPEHPNEDTILLPAFSLFYQKGSVKIPLEGIHYEISMSQGSGGFTESGMTNTKGHGGLAFMARDDLLERTVLRISFAAPVQGYIYRFLHPVLTFIYPRPLVFVYVLAGERIEDLLRRLVDRNLTSNDAFLSIAAEEDYPLWDFVPETLAYINRFEGLFKPGVYSFFKSEVLPLNSEKLQNSDNEDGSSEIRAKKNVKFIIEGILRESAYRYEELPPTRGLDAYSQIILSSIVEKEAVSSRDYDKVASVFYNRLKGGSRIASCPTVEYALKYHRPFLNFKDIAIDSPYNVYIHKGLPPTPICFFSDEALRAVREPPETELYYFVYDWTAGRIYFAEDYQDHLANAKKAKNNYIEKYGKDSLRKIYHDKFYEQ